MDVDSEAEREFGPVEEPSSAFRAELGCWRIRRSPESPKPCSPACSGIIGDLEMSHVSHLSRDCRSKSHLDSLSSSIPNKVLASREKRFLGFCTAREGFDAYEERLLALKFFGSIEELAVVGVRRFFDSGLSSIATAGRLFSNCGTNTDKETKH